MKSVMKKKIAINGFGRIGRTFLRIVMSDKQVREQLDIIAINVGPSMPECLSHLFKYDSVMGKYPGEVKHKGDVLSIDGHEIKLLSHKDPAQLPWKDLGIDWVVESSGCFTARDKALLHCKAGSKKVLITAPSDDADVTVILGVNGNVYDPQKHQVVSLGSCTTNAFAPMVKVIHETFGITQGLMTTVHAYTNDQVLLDVEHKDPRRARAAAINMVPTKTGADKVITKIFPELTGKIKAVALRVPVPVVSLVDFVFYTQKPLQKENINQAFERYAQGDLKNILEYTQEPLVSSDFMGNNHSCIFDSLLTQSVDTMGKVFGWYDNEYGYSVRLKDFLLHN